ncbi:GMC family oxidoreductase [Neorhizobium galegae]|uniref:GMC oxidoreductase n=1 Tax=Neorhizobium galegae TaxID=399 RepID=UPI000621D8EB|nr:GMC family oxidoreductase [Neorhizobium galegae]MCQ1775721.1 GMC family oxidoreductase [Neorhizobium galegae]MCQ1797133.1 GMC family oxidoreductase [Neorhizobium galegae]CDZ30729.1 Glucose-methanol-choline oxidoreductase [Neorhizobium galegae bv. officinalis]CDZ38205.1 Glucose-methanol-choline oxidoreductase [Neorhizobium galegae bv. officinalis]
MSETIYDALVIGSGAAGSFAARELTAQGLSVLLLEAGPAVGAKDFDPSRKKPVQKDINIWERAMAFANGQTVQARAIFFKEWMSHFFVNDRKNPYTTPADTPFLWIRGRQAGGRLHAFGRVLMRWTDDDFNLHSRTGEGADWPISYADLAPFYAEVESYLGLYGQEDNVATLPDGIYAKRANLTPAEEVFKAAVETRWPERRVVSWRYIAPEPERVPRPLRDAQASGRLTIRYNAVVRRITTDDKTGLATGAELTDGTNGRTETVRGANIVVCASPIESIRLLLHSAAPLHPAGLGNSSGTLGRYFMDQLPCLAIGAFPPVPGWTKDETAPPDPFYPGSGGIFIPRFKNFARGEKRSDFAYQGTVGRGIVSSDTPGRMAFFGYGQMLPHADNRVTLDPSRKDAWDIPIPHIRCAMNEGERELLARQEQTLIEMVKQAGGELEFIGSPLGLKEMGRGAYPNADPFSRFLFRRMFHRSMPMGAAIHESGGVRMGTSPDTSVLDAWNRSWDVPNLLVTDASAFPTGGVSGTTLTVMAMTIRACRQLAANYKSHG